MVEGNESIVISGRTTENFTVSNATVSLTDDDATTTDPGDEDDKDSAELSISGPTGNVSEGGNATFTVTLSAAVSKDVTVAWSAPLSADAAEAADLGTTSGTVTFDAGSAAGATETITITATDDDLSENAESFTVTLGAITSTLPASQVSLKNGASSAQGTISASDAITIELSGPSSVDEGDATTDYTVSLSPSGVTPTADLTVSYATSDGTATGGTDYTAKSGTLTFTKTAAGSQTFTVATTADTFDEGTGETFTVSIASPSGGGGPAPSLATAKSVTTTITDDDDAVSGITLSASPNSVGEDDGETEITVTATLDGGSTRPAATVVTIGALAGTATKDTDYEATALASITIAANATSGTGSITITPTDDSVVEGDETITVSGSTTAAVGLTVADATITLTDDDKSTTSVPGDKDSAELSIAGPASSVSEGSDATFTVTLSAAVAKDVTVVWSAPLSADAAESADLGTTSGTVTFAAGSAAGATQTITITATDDDLSETAESFTVTLGAITSTLSSQVSLKNGASSAQGTIAESDAITIELSGPSSVDEGDATGNYTVSLSPSGVTPTADLTVSYATSDGTATGGTDYTAKSGTLTFTNTVAGSQTFTVATTADTFDEGTGETFTVSIASPSGGGGPAPSLATAKSVTTTITDDDDAVSGITLSASPNSLGEDDSATGVTITATLDGGSTRPAATVVTIGALAGTATEDTDYEATALASITIAANQASGTGSLTITPTDDSVVEGDETITVSGTTTAAVGLTVADATITLTDDDKSTTSVPGDKDSAELSIAGPASSVSEGSDATFTVTLSAAVAKDVTVAWSAPLSADAAEAADLGTTSGTVTFAANSAANSTQTITITATDDDLSETAESFTVTLGTITSTLSSQVSLKNGASSAQGTISASDAITIELSGPSSVDEGDATGNYTVSLSPSGVTPTADLTVSYATSDGTAEAEKDYTAKSGTLTFTKTAAGSQTFTVQTTADTFDEGTGETFTVSIASPAGGGGPSPSLATAKSVTTTITDDDAAVSGITLSASPSTLGEDDGETDITVTATLDGGSTRPAATVVTIGALAGTAEAGTGKDYTVNTALASITIGANATSGTGTLTITPTDDSVVEGSETITIPGTTTPAVGLSVSDATVTLTDDDKSTTNIPGDKDSAELSISGPTGNVSEGNKAIFTVTLSAGVSKDVTVAWSAPLSADAAEGADLSATSGTVTFAANSAAGATKTITITATDDLLSETSEAFTVTLGAITSTLSSQVSLKNGAKSATATISASDAVTISMSGPSSVDEGDTTGNYTVSLSPSGVTPTADLTVSYATADGTATAGADYTAKSGTLTFTNTAAGSQTFTVATTADTFDEGTGETFTVSIASPAGGGGPTPSLATAKSVTTTITDDDDAVSGITLSASPSTLGEDDGETEITVTATLDGGSTRPAATVVTIGTLSGTAEAGTGKDYTVNTALASITIAANATSGTGTLTITPTDDSVVEGSETITISGTTTTAVGLTVADATITLTDDDKSTGDIPGDKDSAELSISGPTGNVSEGSNATFTVTLSAAVSKDVTVAWSAPLSADAAEGADLGTTSGTVTFVAGSGANATQTITITATDDSLSENAESFTVTLGAITSTLSSQVSLKSGASSAQVTIAESDPITIELSGPSSVDEGDTTGNYTVSLSPSGVTPTADLTVSYATADGTATAGSDYTAKSGTLTFTNTAAGSQTFTVATTADTFDEGTGETFMVSIASPAGGGGPAPSLATAKSVTTTITDDDNAISGITLSASPNSVGEDDGETEITVTATLDGDKTRPSATVVTIGALAGTAEAGTGKDYTVNTALASVTIPANQASGTGTLTVTPTDDVVVEGDETITISGTTTPAVGLTVADATITLTDDDKSTGDIPGDKDSAELSISGPTGNVSEGNNATFTVTLSAAVSKYVTVAWSAPLSADAAEGSDLSVTSGTVTFAAGSAAGATQTITITATDDDLSENAESFTVTLGAITSTLSSQVSLKNGASSAQATIAASDAISVSISGPSSVDEGEATGNYTVSLSPSGVTPTADLTVSYATADDTAEAGKDYTAKSGTLTFTKTAAGSQTFTVQTAADTFDEGTGETFTVSISSPSGGGGPTPSLATAKSVTTTITDDDDAVSGITLSASPNSVGEDDEATSVTITATLDGGSTRPTATVVTIGALAGTAEAGTGKDYTVNTALASITIAANATSGTGTLTITPADDSVVEGSETITIPGTTTAAVGLTVADATITLTDDDKSTTAVPGDKDSAELSIAGPGSNVSEGSDATFTVTLSAAVSKDVTVAWSAPLSADAAEGADLSATSGTVTFAAGSGANATQTITITATDDDLSENAESFTVTLGAITSTLPASQVSLKNGAKSAQATIDESDPITVSISGPSSVDEGEATGNYTVSLSPSGVTPTADLTVSYATADGTATAGTDYTAKSGTLTFTNTAAGSQTFTVQTTGDTFDEGTGETFTVSIAGPAGGGGSAPTLATAKSVTTTITDDDDAVSGITLSASPNTLGEDDGETEITVKATLDGGSTRPAATVVTIGALTGTATKDTDYEATALASITIAANATSGTGTLTITPAADSVVEGDETIVISGTTTTAVGLSVSDATVTLTDDDKGTTGPGNEDDKDSAELSISGPASNVAEGSGATFTVTLSAAVSKDVTVAWSAPLSADAAEAADLGATSGTVTFDAGSSAGATGTITITATDDDLSENAESFTVTLGDITSTLPTSQVSLKNGAKSAQGTITESDPITVNISGPSSVDEGETTGNYTVSLSPSGVTPTADLTVSYATSDGTATAGSDYTAKSGTLTFTEAAAGSQTFAVKTTADTFDEGTGETFNVSIASPAGGGGPSPSLATAKSVTTTITDDDNAVSGITLSADPNTLGEDDEATSITVTATLDGGSTRPAATVVTIGTLAGTATKDTDYTATALASITIGANATSGTGSITITPTDDSVVEGDETITVSGTTTAAVGLTVADATITLTDDDKSTGDIPGDKDSAELSISGPASSVSEGNDATFTVTMSAAVSKDVTVAWSAPLSADAAEGADMGSTSGTVTFAAGSGAGATQTITITATDDDLSENAESFTVTLGAITSTLPTSQVSLKNGAKSAQATIAESDAITIDLSGPDSVTEGETATYTVSLTPSGVTPSEDLTVDYATSDPSTGAIAGEDYTAVSGTLTFTPTNAGDQQVVVQTTDDILDEGAERFNFKISNPKGGGGPALGVSRNATSTNIIDNDTLGDPPDDRHDSTEQADISLTVDPDSVDEDAGETVFTVTATLDGDPQSKAVTIQLALAGTAELGASKDYTAPSQASVTIPAKQSSGTGTLTLTINDDNENEGDETIIVGGSYESLTIKSAVITINDDEATYLSISGPTANVNEDSNATFTVTLSKTVATDVTVAWTDAPGTAGTSDYSATPATLTFPANSGAGATQTITIAVTDDTLSETAETFAVALGAVTGPDVVHIKTTASNAVATIAENDPISVSISGPSSVSEGDATGNYTVSLTGGTPTADLTVDYATADGTAVAATDYTAKSGTLTFSGTAAGAQTFTVQTTADTFDEGTGETFTVSIASPSGGGGPAPSLDTAKSVTTTITDDDDAVSGITLSASPNSLGEDDPATNITITATLDGGSTRPSATVVTIGTLAGTATKDTDYTATALASITIAANATSGTGSITITPTDDSVVEGDETITVSGTTTAAVGLTVAAATITLTDDDKSTSTVPGDKDSAELSISGPTGNVSEGSNAVFTVTLSHAVSKDVAVAWSAPLSTDAAEAADLGTTSGTVTFAANSAAGATQTITITATDDSLSENAESFTVTLGAITSTLSSQVSLKNGASSATATIAESDPITVSISGPSSVGEGDATGDYTVSLVGGTPTADLTVDYATSDGSATAGSDYTAVQATTLTFTSADHADKTFTVSTIDDTLDESDETFTVSLSNQQGGGATPTLGTSNSVETTITDDDDTPSNITLSVSPTGLGEDDGQKDFTVTATLDGASTLTTATAVNIGVLTGTATKDTDYTVNTALTSITISAGQSRGSGTLTITPTDDSVVEGGETIVLSGTTTTGLAVSDATITLTDDNKSTASPGDIDSAELSITGPTSNVSEGSDSTFTVTLSAAVAKDVTVAWSAPLSADAAESADLGATSGTVTFDAGSAAGATQEITITATDDSLSEAAESFTVTLGAITSTLPTSQVSLKSGASSAQATIAESDPITVSISGPSSVDEGDATGNYTVSLSPSGVTPTADLTVNYATDNGTATAGTDYTAKSGTLTFSKTAAGSQTFTVQTTEDSYDEGTGETFTVSISGPTGGGGPSPSLDSSNMSVTTTITDDDRTVDNPSPTPPHQPPPI